MAGARARRVLICVRRQFDPYGTHDVSSRAFAAAYHALGFTPAFVNLSARIDVPRMLELFRAGEVAFAHCEQGHGLSLEMRIAGKDQGLFDHFGVPAIAHVRDYPFAPWLWPYLLKANQNVFVFHTDACAPDMLRPLGITRGTHRFAPHVALDTPEPRGAERDIPLLYIGSYKRPEAIRSGFLTKRKDLAWAFDGLVDAGADEFDTPIHRLLFQRVLPARGAPALNRAALCDLLHGAHYFIRSERRRRLFQKLVRFPVDIVWDGEVPETRGPIAARIEPKLPFAQALARIGRARTMVMSLNAFTHSLSERLLSAMRSGCVPIVQRNALISQVFRDGVELMLLDAQLDNLEATIARAGDHDALAEMSAAAQRRVATEFSVATRVRQFLRAAAIPLPARAA